MESITVELKIENKDEISKLIDELRELTDQLQQKLDEIDSFEYEVSTQIASD